MKHPIHNTTHTIKGGTPPTPVYRPRPHSLFPHIAFVVLPALLVVTLLSGCAVVTPPVFTNAANLNLDEKTDCRAEHATECQAVFNGSVASFRGALGSQDIDWIEVALKKTSSYEIVLIAGNPTITIHDSADTIDMQLDATNRVFTPPEDGDYYIEVSNGSGVYELSIRAGAVATTETIDCTTDVSTTCSIALPTSAPYTGIVGGVDEGDWVKVELTAGMSYRIVVEVLGDTNPMVTLRTAAGTPVAPGIGTDNLYTASDTAAYFITVGLEASGTYSIAIAAVPEVALTHALDGDDLIVTATVTKQAVGAADVSIDVSVTPGADGPSMAPLTIPASTAIDGPAAHTFLDLPSGAHTLTATVTDASVGRVRLVSIAVPDVKVLPKISLTPTTPEVNIGTDVTVAVSATSDGVQPTGAVTVMVTATPAGGGTPVSKTTAALDSGNNFTHTLTFATGSGSDQLTVDSYSLSASVADSAEAGLVIVPSDTLATIRVVDPDNPTVRVTAEVTDNGLDVQVEVTAKMVKNTAEVITLELSGGPSATPTALTQEVVLPVGYDSDDAAKTEAFDNLLPGSYTLTASAAPGNINPIVYAGSGQDVTIAEPPVTVTLNAVPEPLYYGIEVTATVGAGWRPSAGTRVQVVATHTDRTTVTSADVVLDTNNYQNLSTTLSGLKPGQHTLTATTTNSAFDVSAVNAANTGVMVNPVTVTLTTNPAKTEFLTSESFTVSAQVTNPNPYSGTVTLGLTGVGNPPPLPLSGNIPTTSAGLGPFSAGSHTLRASGTGIAAITDIGFSVAAPAAPAAVVVTPFLVDNDLEVQVAVHDGSTLADEVTITLRLTGQSPKTVRLPAGTANPFGSVRYDNLPARSYSLTATTTSAAVAVGDIPDADSVFSVSDVIPTVPSGAWEDDAASGTTERFRGVAYANGRWVAVSESGVIRVATDPAGVWKVATSGMTNNLWDVAYANGRWVAVGDGGDIRVATDPTGTWTPATSSDTTRWLHGVAYANGRWVAVGGGFFNNEIVTATDPAGVWTGATNSGTTEFLLDVVYANGRWVAVGLNGEIVTATDPTGTWSDDVTSGTIGDLYDVAYANGRWVAVGDGGVIVTATDPAGVWTPATSGATSKLNGVAYGNDRWVAVGDGGDIRVATDPIGVWTDATSGTTNWFFDVAYANGRWVAVGGGGEIVTAPPPTVVVTPIVTDNSVEVQVAIADGTTLPRPIDVQLTFGAQFRTSRSVRLSAGVANPFGSTTFTGLGVTDYTLDASVPTGFTVSVPENMITIRDSLPTNPAGAWTPTTSGTLRQLNGVAYANGRWVAVGGTIGASSDIFTATDPAGTWTPATNSGTTRLLYGVAYANGQGVAVSDSGGIRTATDPAGRWTPATNSSTTGFLLDVAYANGRWVAVGGTIVTATDPAGRWTPATNSGATGLLYGVAYANGRWVAVSDFGTIVTATDPTGAWTPATNSGATRELTSVAYGNGQWVAVGGTYPNSVIVTATDPTGVWTRNTTSGATRWLLDVAYANGQWVAVGQGGEIRTTTDPAGAWTLATNGTLRQLNGVAYANGRWVAVGDFGTIVTANLAFDGSFRRVGAQTSFGVGETFPGGLAAINDTLYMAGTTTDHLYTLDTGTGRATQRSTTANFRFGVGEGGPSGLADIGGTLYMVGTNNKVLYTLNTTNGRATRKGSATNFGVGESSPTGLAAIGTTLYMVGQSNRWLYRVDRNSGRATRVGSATNFGVNETQPRGLAAIGNTLYMVGDSTDTLYTIDTSSGRATRVGSAPSGFGVSENQPRGLAAIGNTLYMLGDSANALYRAVPR